MKYYEKELDYNQRRDEFIDDGFEWYLTHNFYTYERMIHLLLEIEETVELLKNDYHNAKLNELKKRFSMYLCDAGTKDYNNPNADAVRKNVGAIIDFYQKFICRIQNIIKSFPETNLISVMGP